MARSALVAALQAGRSLMLEYLVEMRFASGTMYVWTGVGPFRDANGQVWQGIGRLGSISDFDRNLVSGQTPTLALSGVDPTIAARALAASSEIKGRWFRIFEQYFDLKTLAPVDVPSAVYAGIMDRATMTATGLEATIKVTTTTLLFRRRRVALAYLSDGTQQTLYPGDTGFSEMARLVQASEIWPGYNG